MNCGRDSRPLDTFTRSALRMKKSVRFFDVAVVVFIVLYRVALVLAPIVTAHRIVRAERWSSLAS
jgi:hypothetical protein